MCSRSIHFKPDDFIRRLDFKEEEGILRTPWLNVSVKSKLQHPPRAYPGHLMPFPAREGGNLITTHRGVGNLITSLDIMLRVVLIPRGLTNHGGDKL